MLWRDRVGEACRKLRNDGPGRHLEIALRDCAESLHANLPTIPSSAPRARCHSAGLPVGTGFRVGLTTDRARRSHSRQRSSLYGGRLSAYGFGFRSEKRPYRIRGIRPRSSSSGGCANASSSMRVEGRSFREWSTRMRISSGSATSLRNVTARRAPKPTMRSSRESSSARKRCKPGEWIFGRGWDQNLWPDKKFPTHEALTRAFPNNPVVLTRIDGHALLANAMAMRAAEVTAATRGSGWRTNRALCRTSLPPAYSSTTHRD